MCRRCGLAVKLAANRHLCSDAAAHVYRDECREGYRDSRIHGVEYALDDISCSCELFRVASVAEVLASGPRLGDWSPVCETECQQLCADVCAR